MPRLQHRIGIIDLGSNAVRLLVADYTPGAAFRFVETSRRRVRLSEGMAADNVLRPQAIERTIATLKTFREFCVENGAKQIVAVATAAVRDAANRDEFLLKAREIGLDFRVLSGEEEARASAIAVINSLGVRDGLVIEVGGGSTQVSILCQSRFERGITLPLGAVRLTESFLRSDPVSPIESRDLADHISAAFDGLGGMEQDGRGQLVGVGGTLRALAKIDREDRQYPLKLINGHELELPRLEALIERIKELPVKERPLKIPGLPVDRADIILAGAMVVAAAMRKVGADRLVVCQQGVREGRFYEEFLRPAEPIIPNLRRFSVLNAAASNLPKVRNVGEAAASAEDELLWAAAELSGIDPRVILDEGLAGYSHREIVLIALLCQPGRGKIDFEKYAALFEEGDEERVRRLGEIMISLSLTHTAQ